MEDYFALLDLPHEATPAEIDTAIRQQLRTWQRRTTNPDLTRRQEAERRLRLLADARETLLDDTARAEYLAKLAAPEPTDEPEPAAPGSTADLEGWLATARSRLAKGDYAGAMHAAREARKADGRSAEAWSMSSRANLGMGALRDALTDAKRASDLEPSNPGYYFLQGRVHERLGQLPEARRCYEVAASLNPNADAPRLAAASIIARGDTPEEALQTLEELFERSTDKRQTGAALADCLVKTAERVPAVRTSDGYLITTATEVDAMERLLFRARQVCADPEVVQYVVAVAENVKWAKDRHLRKLDVWTKVGIAAAAVFAILGVWLLWTFIRTFDPLNALAGVVFAGAAAAFAWWVWAPGHALNKAMQNKSAK